MQFSPITLPRNMFVSLYELFLLNSKINLFPKDSWIDGNVIFMVDYIGNPEVKE